MLKFNNLLAQAVDRIVKLVDRFSYRVGGSDNTIVCKSFGKGHFVNKRKERLTFRLVTKGSSVVIDAICLFVYKIFCVYNGNYKQFGHSLPEKVGYVF